MTHKFAYLVTPIILVFSAACDGHELPAPSAGEASPQSDSFAAFPAPGKELPPSQTTPGPIPLDFRHVWAIEAKDCTAEPALTRIAIAPGALKFYEGRSDVISADAPHEGALVLNVTHSSEGQTVNETHTLALDDAKTTMTYQRGGNSFTYKRCD